MVPINITLYPGNLPLTRGKALGGLHHRSEDGIAAALSSAHYNRIWFDRLLCFHIRYLFMPKLVIGIEPVRFERPY